MRDVANFCILSPTSELPTMKELCWYVGCLRPSASTGPGTGHGESKVPEATRYHGTPCRTRTSLQCSSDKSLVEEIGHSASHVFRLLFCTGLPSFDDT